MRAVRDLRRLKCNASSGVETQLQALELMKGNSMHILEKMNRYKKVGATKKQESSLAKHKFAWLKEMKQLHQERLDTERELQQMNLLSHTAADSTLRQIDEEQRHLKAETSKVADKISNDYREIVDLVAFVKVRQGEELRTMAAHCNSQIENFKDYLCADLTALEAESDRLEEEIAAQRHGMNGTSASVQRTASRCVPSTEIDGAFTHHASVLHGVQIPMGSTPLTGPADSSPEELELSTRLASLDCCFIEQLEQLRAHYESEVDPKIVHSPTGGWTKRAHAVFEKVLHEFNRAGELGREGQQRRRFFERLRLELAAGQHEHAPDKLEQHVDWHDKLRFYHAKRRACLRRWRLEKRQTIEDVERESQEAAVEALNQIQRQIEQATFEAAREELHARLTQLRAANEENRSAIAAAEAKRLQAELEAQKQLEFKWQQEMLQKKAAIQSWRSKQAEEAAAMLAREEENKALLLEQYRETAELNAQRVAFRMEEFEARKQQAAQEQAQQTEAERAREYALEALAASVAPHVDRDPQRVLKDTAASAPLSREDRDFFRLQDRKGTHTMTGYTSKQICGDRRTKLTNALVEAGLHKTAYGQAAIRAVAPAHNISQHLTSATHSLSTAQPQL